MISKSEQVLDIPKQNVENVLESRTDRGYVY